MKRQSLEFLHDIITALDNIEKYIEGYDFEKFQNDDRTFFAVVKNVENIGEALKNVPNDILESYHEFPWKKWIAMRDRLTHAYFHIDLFLIWETIHLNSENLRKGVNHLIQNYLNNDE